MCLDFYCLNVKQLLYTLKKKITSAWLIFCSGICMILISFYTLNLRAWQVHGQRFVIQLRNHSSPARQCGLKYSLRSACMLFAVCYSLSMQQNVLRLDVLHACLYGFVFCQYNSMKFKFDLDDSHCLCLLVRYSRYVNLLCAQGSSLCTAN